MAHALRQQYVTVRLAAPCTGISPTGVSPEASALYHERRRRGRHSGIELVEPSDFLPCDGWRSWDASDGQGLLSPAVMMLSRDTEPICWPKAWHFALKMARMSDDECRDAFGSVPVRWVNAAHRWSCGNRHRLTACLLLGRDLPVRVQSGSQRPDSSAVRGKGEG